MKFKKENLILKYQSIINYPLYISLICALIIFIINYFLSILIPQDSSATAEVKSLFIQSDQVRPEGKERALYLLSYFLILPLTFFVSKKIKKNQSISYIVIAIIYSLLYFTNYTDDNALILGELVIYDQYFYIASVILSIFIMFNGGKKSKGNSINLYIIGITISLLIFLSRIKTIELVGDNIPWSSIVSHHFDAFYYSITQFYNGGFPLVDFPPQYGFYSVFLKPILNILGLSIFSITTLLSLLNLLAIWLIISAITFNLIKSRAIKFLSIFIVPLVLSGSLVASEKNYADIYLQYYPLRVLFPCIYIYLIYRYLKRPSPRGLAFTALIAGLALLWNLDSGIPIAGSLLIYLILEFLFNRNINNSRNLLYSGFLMIIVLGCFFSYISIKGQFHYSDWFKVQNLVYGLGFYALPMPLRGVEFWMILQLVYILGIAQFFINFNNGTRNLKSNFIFIISILGMGLFTYYQGRSYIGNFYSVIWPGVIILIIFSDVLMRLSNIFKYNLKIYLLLTPIILIFSYLIFSYINIGLINSVKTLKDEYYFIKNFESIAILDNIKFIKKYAVSNRKILIDSNHQSIYMGELNLLSPYYGPGSSETLLVSDREKLFNNIYSRPVPYFFSDFSKIKELPPYILNYYYIKDESRYGLIYLERY